ncbi:MAG TPA: hypothetical protein VGG60_04685, partial [Candidatus Binataceae bacterium]
PLHHCWVRVDFSILTIQHEGTVNLEQTPESGVCDRRSVYRAGSWRLVPSGRRFEGDGLSGSENSEANSAAAAKDCRAELRRDEI